MTIQSTTGKVTVNGNGSATSFSFSPMTIFEDTDLTVTFVDTDGTETLLTEGAGTSNYAVVVSSYPGTGSITYPASGTTKLAVGQKLVMKPVVPLTQEMALSTQGPYDPTLQETAFDRQTVIAQQQQEQVDRSVTLPIGVSGVSTILPVPSANTVLAWASDALSLINVGIAALGSTVASVFSLSLFLLTTAAAWRTALGLGTAATAATGTSGANVPLLNAAATFSAGLTVTTAGLVVGAPTGGDQGAGSINVDTHAYADGVRIDNVAQVVKFQTGTFASGTTTIPLDDTIPQITEGDQYMTLAVTPKNAASTLVIKVVANTTNGVTVSQTLALFQDATANALACVAGPGNSTSYPSPLALTHTMAAGTTSATTFRVRVGASSAGTTYFNGAAGARLYGGALASSIVITEILP